MLLTHTQARIESRPTRKVGWLTLSMGKAMTLTEDEYNNLLRQFEELLEAAREAASEAGTWNLPDQFVDSIEARLRILVRSLPEALEVDAAILEAEVVARKNELRELEGDIRASASSNPPRITIRSTAAIGLVGGLLAGFVVLNSLNVSIWTSLLIYVLAIACGISLPHITSRGAGLWRICRARYRMRHLKADLAEIVTEIRRMARSRAQINEWVAQAQKVVEAEYWRFRARATAASQAPAQSNLSEVLQPASHSDGLGLTIATHVASR